MGDSIYDGNTRNSRGKLTMLLNKKTFYTAFNRTESNRFAPFLVKAKGKYNQSELLLISKNISFYNKVSKVCF